MIACATPEESGAPSWETFQAMSRREVDGNAFYVVEWDQAMTLDQLREYYDRNVIGAGGGIATTSQASTVAIDENGGDIVWRNDDQRRLTYCVSDTFGSDKQRAADEMASAAHAWEAVAPVSFRYLPAHDGNCSNSNTSVSFAVQPWGGAGACSFYPDGTGCVARTLVMNFVDLDTHYGTVAPNVRTVGVFRHELGHILGLRHEQLQLPKSGGCILDTGTWRGVTAYDNSSVMHYPWCSGNISSDLSITALDREGIRKLYPLDLGAAHDTGGTFDLDGDGRADVCGRGGAGIHCALSTGTGYGPTTLWSDGYKDGDGWSVPEYYASIRFPDLDGDHRADICGRGAAGIYCALSTGAGFGPVKRWESAFSDANGWSASLDYYATVQFPDINGDGRADVCGRGGDGIYCALSTGASFGAAARWSAKFGDGDGWAQPEYASTIRFPDVNGDGRADVCGRGGDGVHCALSTGASFGEAALWSAAVSDAAGWNKGPEYYATIRFPDINGDGRADLCGRSAAGLRCALSNGSSFPGAFPVLVSGVSDAAGWGANPAYFATLHFGDIDGDGRADVCGRGASGMYCARSTGAGFTAFTLQFNGVSDAFGWAVPHYYATLRMADLDGDGRADVCGRGASGIYCAISTGTGFTIATRRTTSFSDNDGWFAHPYYGTLQFP